MGNGWASNRAVSLACSRVAATLDRSVATGRVALLASSAKAVASFTKKISRSMGITSPCGKALPAHEVWPSAGGRFYYAEGGHTTTNAIE